MSENESIDLDTHIAVPLCYDLGVIEDWLLHCSSDTLEELADFAYHANHDPRFAVAELIGDLGRYSVTINRLLKAQIQQQR